MIFPWGDYSRCLVLEKKYIVMGCILVIDDEEAILKPIHSVLKRLGYEVEVARDGKEAIAVFENHSNVEMVITDIRMPEMDGNSVARYIRNSESEGVPIVGITGYDDGIDKDLFDSLLLKPFKIQDLVKLIKTFPKRNSDNMACLCEEKKLAEDRKVNIVG